MGTPKPIILAAFAPNFVTAANGDKILENAPFDDFAAASKPRVVVFKILVTGPSAFRDTE
jgi:hypothetical protein